MRLLALGLLILGCTPNQLAKLFKDVFEDVSWQPGPPVYPPLSPYPSCPSCQHAQFVVSEMRVPTSYATAEQLGCEFNSDAQVYNQMGATIAMANQICH